MSKYRIKEISRHGYKTFIPQYRSFFRWHDYTYTDYVNNTWTCFKYSFDTLEEAKEFITNGGNIKYHYL